MNQRNIKRKPAEKCAICGALSKYVNYNVAACDACKQFFRRIVVSQKMYQCRREGECNMHSNEVKCRGCRLDRCLVEGMDCALVEIEVTQETKAFRGLLNQRRREALQRLQQQQQPMSKITGQTANCPVLGHLRIVEGKSRHFLKSHLAFREGFLEQFGSLKELLSFGQNIVCNFEKFAVSSVFMPIELSSATVPTGPVFAARDSPFNTGLVEAFEFFRLAPVVTSLNAADQPFNRAQLREDEYLLLRAIIVAHPAAPGISQSAQTILQEESERLAAILVKMLRRERGDFEGMKMYAELIHLVEVAVQVSAKGRELIAYIAIMTDREQFANFPKALQQLCF